MSPPKDGTDHVPRDVPNISRARRPEKNTLIVSGRRKIATVPIIEPSILHG